MANKTNLDEGRIVQASDATDVTAEARRARVGSPISNEAYDVVAALHEKLEALDAYKKFANDGDADLWQRMTQTEMAGVRLLVDRLEQLVREDKLRIREPDISS